MREERNKLPKATTEGEMVGGVELVVRCRKRILRVRLNFIELKIDGKLI